MRTIDVLTTIPSGMRGTFVVLMIAILLVSPALAAGGSIEENTTWSGEISLTENTTISGNSTLIVNGDITTTSDHTITVEAGSTLEMDGAKLQGLATYKLKINNSATVVVPVTTMGPDGNVKIKFSEDVAGWANLNITIDGNTEVNVTGREITMPADLSGDNVTIEFTHPWQYIHIAEIQLSDGSSQSVVTPELLSGNETQLISESDTALWHLIVKGTLTVNNSELIGGEIICEGSCTIIGSTLTSSGPIEISNSASLNIADSTMTGSRTDEDIVAHDSAIISWTNSIGTGGIVDNWIRLLSNREFLVDVPEAIVTTTGIGYFAGNSTGDRLDCSALSPDDCDGRISIANSKVERIVEWQDGNGLYGTEQASATVSVDTIWGKFSATVSMVPHTNEVLINIPLPNVAITSVEPADDKGDANFTLGVQIHVANSGATDASVRIECFVDGEYANIAPSTPTINVAAGGTAMVPVNWRNSAGDDVVLDCKLIIPTQFKSGDFVGTNASTSSTPVTWEAVDDEGSNLFYPILITVIIAIGGGTVIMRNRSQ
jgi:hypothetical protein